MKTLFEHVVFCSRAKEVSLINRTDITGVIWDRNVSKSLNKAVNELRTELKHSKFFSQSLMSCNLPISQRVIKTFLARCFYSLPNLKSETVMILARDIQKLAVLFAQVSSKQRINLSLNFSLINDFDFFHIDGLAMRIVTTYFGEGTEWLPNQAVDANCLKRSYVQPLPDYKKLIQKTESGQVLILKGMQARNCKHKGLVHRTPLHVKPRLRLMIDYT